MQWISRLWLKVKSDAAAFLRKPSIIRYRTYIGRITIFLGYLMLLLSTYAVSYLNVPISNDYIWVHHLLIALGVLILYIPGISNISKWFFYLDLCPWLVAIFALLSLKYILYVLAQETVLIKWHIGGIASLIIVCFVLAILFVKLKEHINKSLTAFAEKENRAKNIASTLTAIVSLILLVISIIPTVANTFPFNK